MRIGEEEKGEKKKKGKIRIKGEEGMLRSTTDRANIEQSASGERRQKFDCRFY